METLISNLILNLENYLEGKATLQEVEKSSSDLIEKDEEYLKDEELSQIVYQLDMNDIEELKREDFVQLLAKLKTVKQNLK